MIGGFPARIIFVAIVGDYRALSSRVELRRRFA